MSKGKRFKQSRLALPAAELMERDLIFYNNPILVHGLALAPIVVAATTLQNAVMLCILAAVIILPTRFFAALISRGAPFKLRGWLYSIVAALCYIPALLLLRFLFGVRVELLGLYLPMFVVDQLVISRCEILAAERSRDALRNGLMNTVAFSLVVLPVGLVREIAVKGTVWGFKIIPEGIFPIMSMACGGFLLIALLSALWQWIIISVKSNTYKGGEADR